MNNIKLIIFDLDGTLVDAYKAIIESVNFTLVKFNLPKQSDLKIRRAVGWGDRELIGAFVSEKDTEKVLKIYRRHHKLSLRIHARLIPGALKLLDFLDKQGYKLAVATNRPTFFTNIALKHLKIRKYFDYVLCGDKLTKGKPIPEILNKIIEKFKIEKKEAIFIGDMALDAQTARRAGIKGIIVRGGSSSLEEIKKERPFKIIKGLTALVSGI